MRSKIHILFFLLVLADAVPWKLHSYSYESMIASLHSDVKTAAPAWNPAC